MDVMFLELLSKYVTTTADDYLLQLVDVIKE